MFKMKFLRKISYNFINVDFFSSQDIISSRLKLSHHQLLA